jgi:hypothetical protein
MGIQITGMEALKIPAELEKFSSLLSTMGFKWLTLCHPPNAPEAKWRLVSLDDSRAGRVGMTISQAEEEVIGMAAARLQWAVGRLGELGRRLDELTNMAQRTLEKL